MINWTEIPDGDTWELFARDFLAKLGFVIDIGPGRGADAGCDLVISEQLRGRLHTRKFTWLVSCKHYAVSDRSVGPDQESNITDRLKQHGADGFMGFYSTMPSARLVERLQRVVGSGDISAYEIFDSKKIEGHFVDTGLSKLALRYFPTSYERMRPIQRFFGPIRTCVAKSATPTSWRGACGSPRKPFSFGRLRATTTSASRACTSSARATATGLLSADSLSRAI